MHRIFALVLLLSCCTPVFASKCSLPAMQEPHATFVIYVYGGSWRHASIYLDGQKICSLRDGRYLIVHVAPGQHKIRSSDSSRGAEETFKAGLDYYFLVHVIPMGKKTKEFRNFWSLDLVSASEGDPAARSLKPQDGETKPLPTVLKKEVEDITGPPNKGSSRSSGEVPVTGTPCLFKFDVVPDCIRKSATGAFIIAPSYLQQLQFDSHQLAQVRSESAPHGWMYVNRSGTVVVSGVPTVDNWADGFHNGLVRIIKDGKFGFADRKGKIVIPASYDWASPFEKGVAQVCNGCSLQEYAGDCEHRAMVGGQWSVIDTHGKVVQKSITGDISHIVSNPK